MWIGGLDLQKVAFGVHPDIRQDPNIREMLKIIRQTLLPHNFIEVSIFQNRRGLCPCPATEQHNLCCRRRHG